MNGTLNTVDGRPALRFERRLAYPVERVWRAVSEPAALSRWFVASVPWKPESGETFEALGQTGEIVDLDAPRLLAWTWGGELFRFELSPEGEACVLVFTHVFDDAALGAQHAAGWESYLNRLDAHLAGRFLSEEEAHAGGAERQARYAEQFRAGPSGAAAPPLSLEEGPILRLERRYEHSIERVWRAVADPAGRANWFPGDGSLTVTESVPPRLLEAFWGEDALRFELLPAGDGCILVFTHAFAERETAARSAAGWDRCFARFEALLVGDPMSEADSLAEWPEVHDRYAERFGVDPELGRRAYAEHPLT
jgi:uncharacterized protein YndB with AHSA1/START domain